MTSPRPLSGDVSNCVRLTHNTVMALRSLNTMSVHGIQAIGHLTPDLMISGPDTHCRRGLVGIFFSFLRFVGLFFSLCVFLSSTEKCFSVGPIVSDPARHTDPPPPPRCTMGEAFSPFSPLCCVLLGLERRSSGRLRIVRAFCRLGRPSRGKITGFWCAREGSFATEAILMQLL